MQQWESDKDCRRAAKKPSTKRGAGGASTSPGVLGSASTDGHEGLRGAGAGKPPPTIDLVHDPRRTVPDKILDRLVRRRTTRG